jgi:glycosyltransferase involved in cell wall biosynthesis
MNRNQDNNGYEVSVVIATLGGPLLSVTIDSLMSGSKVPAEILICIPVDHAHKVTKLASDTVKIIATEVRGQVKQRAYGFTQAVHALVLQLDDDILLEKDALFILTEHIRQLGKGNVVGPVYYGQTTNRCIHELQRGLLKNIFDSLICAAPWDKNKMGVVTGIGLNYGVDDFFCKEELKQTDWLPGGCVLSYREDLVLDDFFPFAGKAYCEDIFHSYYRTSRGIRSWVATRVRVYIEEPVPEFGSDAIKKVISIRRHFLKLIQGPKWRLRLYELFSRIRGNIYSSKKQ